MSNSDGEKQVASAASGNQIAMGQSEQSEQAASDEDMRIVAIGASAGGLEPLEQMFDHMPKGLNMAFIVIQHLSPDFRSMMDELLARHSSMRIEHPIDGVEIKANTIYLNPAREEMRIRDGKLWLTETRSQTDLRLPIDTLMDSLAEYAGKRAVAIILSGTGSDGAIGAESVRNAGGMVIVQDPDSAKFDGMPRAALKSAYPTLTATPEAMGPLLQEITDGKTIVQEEPIETVKNEDPHHEILSLLERRYATDFNYYKLSTVERRISRRASLKGANSLADYAVICHNSPEEVELLYSDLLIGVTAFFRDRELFDILRDEVIPRICKTLSDAEPIRIWVPGCATGEEAYSLAILISEYCRHNNLTVNAKIFATDIHYRSLEIATRGEYEAAAVADLPEAIRARYFDKVDELYRVNRSLRPVVVFSNHNVLRDPPFTSMHMVSCRNLLIYFNIVAQHKALAMFHFALKSDGTLLLGPSETTADLSEEFSAVNQKWRLYTKLRDVTLLESTRLLPMSTKSRQVEKTAKIPSHLLTDQHRGQRLKLSQAYDWVLDKYAPPGLLNSRSGELLHVFGDGRKYLDVPTGAFTSRLKDIVPDSFKAAISVIQEQVKAEGGRVVRRDVVIDEDDEGEDARRVVTIEGESLPATGPGAEYVLLTFHEKSNRRATTQSASDTGSIEVGDQEALIHRIQELELDLRFKEESLQSTIQELEASNEEMQASNEELMATNEELQSTNEELHSVNEELFTISSEHQQKIQELTELTTDMEHLLQSTDIGTLFLDEELRIRRFTPNMAHSFHLLERDIGRPLEHVTSRFTHPDFMRDLRHVIKTGATSESEVAIDTSAYLLRMLPYKISGSSDVRGVVVTLTDVTRLKDVQRLKKAERNLAMRNDELASVNKNLEQFTYVVSHDLRAPLRAIRNAVQWIEEDFDGEPNDKVSGHLARLRRQSSRLSEMLTDLLEYSRLGSEELPTEEMDLGRNVREIANYLEQDAELQLDIGDGLPVLRSHRAPLRLVFQNLIENAVKYCGSRVVQIKIRARPIAGGYVFVCADTGPGINPDFHEKIFLPFQKLEHREEKPGSGMGLALVRKAVEAHGGQIRVKSQPNLHPGTRFIFTWMVEKNGKP